MELRTSSLRCIRSLPSLHLFFFLLWHFVEHVVGAFFFFNRLRLLFFLLQKGGEAVDSAGADGDFAEAESGATGGVPEQEVLAARSAPEENPSHQASPHQTPGACLSVFFASFFL